MPVNYKIAKYTEPGTRENRKQHPAPVVISESKVSFKELLKIMSEKTKLNEITQTFFFCHFEAILAELLKEGKILQVGTIGTFYPVVKFKKDLAEKTGKPEDMELAVRFRPSMDLKERLSDAKVVRVKG